MASFLIGSAIDWVVSAIRPVQHLNSYLRGMKGDDKGNLAKSWSFPFTISVFIQLIALQFVGGPKKSDFEYYIVFSVSFIVSTITVPLIAFFIAFLLSRKARFGMVLQAFSIYILYLPFLVIWQIPTLLNSFQLVEYFAQKGMNLSDSILYFIKHGKEISEYVSHHDYRFSYFPSVIGDLLFLFATTLFCEALRQLNKLPRASAYIAGAAAVYISFLPQLAINVLQAVAALPFIPDALSKLRP